MTWTGCLVLLALRLVGGAGAAHGADADRILELPRLPGWKESAAEEAYQLRQLTPRVLTDDAGLMRITVSTVVRAQALNPACDSGSIELWSPDRTDWIAIRSQGAECVRMKELAPSKDPQYLFWGQARCAHANSVQVFNFWSRASADATSAAWRDQFMAVVQETRMTVACLSPEETAYLVDFEGPPFVIREQGRKIVDVAARSMCGTGGCGYFRFVKRGECYELTGCNVRDPSTPSP